jgi:hypothetical protein
MGPGDPSLCAKAENIEIKDRKTNLSTSFSWFCHNLFSQHEMPDRSKNEQERSQVFPETTGIEVNR